MAWPSTRKPQRLRWSLLLQLKAPWEEQVTTLLLLLLQLKAPWDEQATMLPLRLSAPSK